MSFNIFSLGELQPIIAFTVITAPECMRCLVRFYFLLPWHLRAIAHRRFSLLSLSRSCVSNCCRVLWDLGSLKTLIYRLAISPFHDDPLKYYFFFRHRKYDKNESFLPRNCYMRVRASDCYASPHLVSPPLCLPSQWNDRLIKRETLSRDRWRQSPPIYIKERNRLSLADLMARVSRTPLPDNFTLTADL